MKNLLDLIRDRCVCLAADERYIVTRDPVVTAPHYRPPGLWVWYDIHKIDPYSIGAPLLWYFPPPYHVLEVLAVNASDFGGRKSEEGPLTDREWEDVKKTADERYAGWVSYTGKLAVALGLTPAAVRVLYHVFTPLRTNGCEPETTKTIEAARHIVYSWFGRNAFSSSLYDWAGKEDSIPRRMGFWGKETTEETARWLFN